MGKKLTLFVCAAALAGLGNAGAAPPTATGNQRNVSPQKAPEATLPYYNDFNAGEETLDGWTFVNPNPEYSWGWNQSSGVEYTPCLGLSQQRGNDDSPSDNWAYTPAFSLQAGFTYQLKFYLSNWFPADMEVRLTTTTDPTKPGTLLWHYEGQDWGDKEISFEVPSSGDYYIAFYDKSPYTTNGTALRYQIHIDNLSLMALSNNAVPEPVGSLTQVPGANGEISMGLEWTNPTLSKMGEELDVLTEVQIFKDGKPAETLRTGLTPGAKMSWTDPQPTAGVHTYKVVVCNSTGESDPAEVNTFVGIDDPGTPANLMVDYDADGGIITLDWEEPAFGRRGGWFDRTGLSYRVVRQPGNKILVNNLTDLSFEDEDLTEYGNYIYEVTSRTNSGLGGTAISNGVTTGQYATLPIIEGWEDPNTYPVWEIVDNNADGHTIGVRHAFGHESGSAIGWDYLTTEVNVDESLYSAPVRLEKGKKYRASFWIFSNAYASFSCDFTYGKAKTRAAQTNSLITYSGMTTGGGYAPSDVKEFTVSETGTYYFSLWVHDCSHHRLWFDDFRIEEVVDKNMEATAVRNLNNAPTVGDKLTTGVTYTNRGTDRSSSFKVQLLDDDNNVLGEQSVSRAIAAGTDGTANIEWTVPAAVGRFGLRGRVVMDGDKCEADNTSAPLYIDIQEKGKRAITIGTGSDQGSAPFHYYAYNFSETIYPGEEFGNIAGDMYAMAFKVQFGMEGDYPAVPFRVYLGNTTEEDLFKGWIPADYRMTKVFDGTIDIMRGMTEVVIPFDTPFSYGGNNLCVLVEGQHDPALMISNGYGMSSYVTEVGLGATRVWDETGVRPDPANPTQSVGRYYTYRPNAVFYIDHSVSAAIKGTITDTDGNPVEGAIVNGGYSYPNLKAETDKDGNYEIPYFPVGWGSASLEVSKKGYETGRPFGQLKAGETATIDFNQMKKCQLITVKGKITSSVDNATPIAGAKITAIGDNELSAVTDAEGNYEIKEAYANKAYPVFTIEAEGYNPVNWANNQFRPGYGTDEAELNTSLKPVTAAPFSVTASDRGDKAVISWEEPVEDLTVTKATDEIVGMFGAPGVLTVGHRYSPEELKNLGVGEDLLLKAIRFMPMCYAKLSLAVWQGPEGNEAPVYLEDVTTDKFKEWNTFNLSEPYKIDPTKSLIIGMKLQTSSGSYPIGFDYGPLAEGGDVLFDPTMNQWTTGHDVLPGQMAYNWAIQGVFGNDANSAPVPWITKEEPAKAKAINIHSATLEQLALLNGDRKDASAIEGTDLSKAVVELLDTPLHAPSARGGLQHEVKGYNVYRLEPGQENVYMGLWTKLTPEPIKETTFTDESWNEAEDKPYRYAVASFYGNPYTWGDGVISDPTFSDGVDKGRYASVTIKVAADKGSVENARVFLVGDGKSLCKAVEKGKDSVTFDDIRFTDYEVKAVKPYFNLYTSDLNVGEKSVSHEAALKFSAPAVPDLNATDYINEARLAWGEPTAAVGMDIHSKVGKPGTELTGYNAGKETIVGYRLTPDARAGFDYTDFYVDEISFYANATGSYYPVVWQRNLEPQRPLWEQAEMEEEHEIYRQRRDVSADEVGTWITVKLDEPVKINSKDTYYIGFGATNTNEATPLILDESGKDPEGMWYYDYSMKDARYMWIRPNMNGSWMVKAHITDTPDNSTLVKEPVNYNIYRLANTDTENEQKWTKVNSAPVSSTEYKDTTWKDQAAADYLYAVKAVYEGDAASAATFSKELPKGKVTLVNMEVKTNNGLSPAGAKVALTLGRDIYRAEVPADGKVEIPEVKKNKNYALTVSLPGYEEISEKTTLDKDILDLKYELAEIKEAPIYLEAVAASDNSKVDLTWRRPGEYAPAQGWVHWDNGQPYGGFGTSTGFCAVAHAYMPEDLESMRMKEYDITKLSFFPTSSKSNPVSDNSYWIAKIWRVDMNSGEAEEVASADASDVKLDNWNEVVFDTPYHVNGDETLLIGYEFHGSGNALGIDQGPCKMGRGDWANFGEGWLTLSSAVSNFNYNNLIHVYMENLGKANASKAPAIGKAQPILKDAKAEVEVSKVDVRKAARADHPQLAFGVNYPYKGFLVYRLKATDTENESAWTSLTPQPISATEFSDINWKNVGKGSYLWAVKAVYATGNSEPEFSMTAYNEDGSVSEIENINADEIRVERISRDRLLVDVPADAEISMVDAAGMTIITTSLNAGENILNVNVADGVYMIRIESNGIVRAFKMLIK